MWVEAADVSMYFLLHINDLWPSLCEIKHTLTHPIYVWCVDMWADQQQQPPTQFNTLIKCDAAPRHQRNEIRFRGSLDLKVTNTESVCLCVNLNVSESVCEFLLWHDLLLVLIVKWTEI